MIMNANIENSTGRRLTIHPIDLELEQLDNFNSALESSTEASLVHDDEVVPHWKLCQWHLTGF